MMTTLLIDTSNQPLAVALVKDGNVLINYQSNIKKNHSLQLMPVIESLMDEVKVSKESGVTISMIKYIKKEQVPNNDERVEIS